MLTIMLLQKSFDVKLAVNIAFLAVIVFDVIGIITSPAGLRSGDLLAQTAVVYWEDSFEYNCEKNKQ